MKPNFTLLQKICLLTLLSVFQIAVYSQVTYTWNGGNGSWTTAANWTPNRGSPAANDVIQFNDGGTYTVSNVPAETIGQLLITNNTDVTLDPGGFNTLSVNGPTLTNNIVVASGSVLQFGSSSTLRIRILTTANQRVNVSGTVIVPRGYFDMDASGTNICTVTGTITVSGSGAAEGSTSCMVFSAGAVYNHDRNGGNIVDATWNASSTCNVTGVTSSPANFEGGSPTFGNFVYDCPGQVAPDDGNLELSMTVNGDLSVLNGTLCDNDNQITGNATGTLTVANGAALQIGNSGTATTFPTNFTNANINLEAGSTVIYGSSTTQTVSGTPDYSNLTISNNGNSTADGALTINGNLLIEGGSLYDGGYQITGNATGTLTITNGERLYLGSGASATTFPTNFTTANISLASSAYVYYQATSDQTVAGSVAGVGPDEYPYLYINNASTKTLNADITVTGRLDINTGADFDVNGKQVTISNDYDNDGTLTADGAGSTLIFDDASSQTFIVGTYTNSIIDSLIVANTNSSGLILDADLNVNNLNIETGCLFDIDNFTLGLAGSYTNNGEIELDESSSILEMNGSAAQNLNIGTYTSSEIDKLIINNTAGVTLDAPVTAYQLEFTAGKLNSTAANLITVKYTGASGITGASATSYVNGPLCRYIPSTSSNTYTFPVGKTAYGLMDLIITDATGGSMYVQAEFFEAGPGGTAGNGITALGATYWEVSKISGTGTMPSANVTLYEAGTSADDRVGYSSTKTGIYDNAGGSGTGSEITSVADYSGLGFFTICPAVELTGEITVGTGGDFTNLTNIGGLFFSINMGPVTGDLTIKITSDLSSESGDVALEDWPESPVSSDYSITFVPDGNTLRTIEGSYAGTDEETTGLFRLNGVDKVTFDGRDPGNKAAGGRYLLFRNTENGASRNSTFNLLNGCTYDTLQYIIVENSGGNKYVGAIRLGRLSEANSNILIDNCHIRNNTSTSSDVATGILGYGVSSTKQHADITVSNNEIYNLWDDNGDNMGIYVWTYCTDWTITGNHFYLNIFRDIDNTNQKYGIYVDNSTGENFIIDNNYIGGSAPYCGDTAWTFENPSLNNVQLCAIYFDPKAGAAGCEIKNNKINNFKWIQDGSTSTPYTVFNGIYNVEGNTLIKDNIIGASTGTDSIHIYCGADDMNPSDPLYAYGIQADAGDVTIENNVIGSITFESSDLGSTEAPVVFKGINITGTGKAFVTGNLIGSETTALSINNGDPVTGNADQSVTGIYIGSEDTCMADSNIIANLHNNNDYYISGSQTVGIRTGDDGAKIIRNNRIFNLTNACYTNGYGVSARVIGIYIAPSASGSFSASITGNTIYNLESTYTSTVSGGLGVTGIAYWGRSVGTHEISRNVIHSLTLNTPKKESQITGIYMVREASVENNMIRLGIDGNGNSIDTAYNMQGIWQITCDNGTNFYYNTVYIGGSNVVGAGTETHAFYCSDNTTVATSLINNIFINNRSNASGTDKHYCIELASSSNFTSDYNCLTASGTGGNIGCINTTDYTNLADWQNLFSSNDANSITGDPGFVDELGDASAVDLHISATSSIVEGAATNIGISVDIDIDSRLNGSGYDIGADEFYDPVPVELIAFDAEINSWQQNLVDLSWTTATETNNDYFIVERSVDSRNYDEIERINGAGNSNTRVDYKTQDNMPYAPLGYVLYRLKQVDFDGHFTCSEVEIVFTPEDHNNDVKLVIGPNPCREYLLVHHQGLNKEKIRYGIFSADGKMMISGELSGIQESEPVVIPVESIPGGIYIIRMAGNNHQSNSIFVKD